MKEHPILFSTPMVQANIEGRKSQTRRVMDFCKRVNSGFFDEIEFRELKLFKDNTFRAIFDTSGNPFSIKCPFGQPGDLLWVRESFRLAGWDFENGTMTIEYKDGKIKIVMAYDPTEDSMWLLDQVESLESNGFIEPVLEEERYVFTDKTQPFKPSILMPKEAARIWLEVEEIRVERLQNISEEDAIAEGISQVDTTPALYNNYLNGLKTAMWPGYGSLTKTIGFTNPVDSFRSLFEKINGPVSWLRNPWIWVVKYKVLSTTGKPKL